MYAGRFLIHKHWYESNRDVLKYKNQREGADSSTPDGTFPRPHATFDLNMGIIGNTDLKFKKK